MCDGRDNDCDGVVDEGFDQDHDGHASCRGDCDDTNPLIYPGADTLPGNLGHGCTPEEGEETVETPPPGCACQVHASERRRRPGLGAWLLALGGLGVGVGRRTRSR